MLSVLAKYFPEDAAKYLTHSKLGALSRTTTLPFAETTGRSALVDLATRGGSKVETHLNDPKALLGATAFGAAATAPFIGMGLSDYRNLSQDNGEKIWADKQEQEMARMRAHLLGGKYKSPFNLGPVPGAGEPRQAYAERPGVAGGYAPGETDSHLAPADGPRGGPFLKGIKGAIEPATAKLLPRLGLRTPEEERAFLQQAVSFDPNEGYRFKIPDDTIKVGGVGEPESRAKRQYPDWTFGSAEDEFSKDSFKSYWNRPGGDPSPVESGRILRRVVATIKDHAQAFGPRSYRFIPLQDSAGKVYRHLFGRSLAEGYILTQPRAGEYSLVRQSGAPKPTGKTNAQIGANIGNLPLLGASVGVAYAATNSGNETDAAKLPKGLLDSDLAKALAGKERTGFHVPASLGAEKAAEMFNARHGKFGGMESVPDPAPAIDPLVAALTKKFALPLTAAGGALAAGADQDQAEAGPKITPQFRAKLGRDPFFTSFFQAHPSFKWPSPATDEEAFAIGKARAKEIGWSDREIDRDWSDWTDYGHEKAYGKKITEMGWGDPNYPPYSNKDLPDAFQNKGGYDPLKAIAPLALSAGLLGAGANNDQADAMLLGPEAKGISKAALGAAKRAMAGGADRGDVWRRHLWGQDAGGNWLTETDDSGMRVTPGYGKIGDLVHNPNLFAARPDLQNKMALIHDRPSPLDDPRSDYNGGGFWGDSSGAFPGSTFPHMLHSEGRGEGSVSTVAHELQHGVDSGKRPYGAFGAGHVGAGRTAITPEWMNSIGEVRARNVQRRLYMTPEDRRAKPFWETEDVPAGQQITKDTITEGERLRRQREMDYALDGLKQAGGKINDRFSNLLNATAGAGLIDLATTPKADASTYPQRAGGYSPGLGDHGAPHGAPGDGLRMWLENKAAETAQSAPAPAEPKQPSVWDAIKADPIEAMTWPAKMFAMDSYATGHSAASLPGDIAKGDWDSTANDALTTALALLPEAHAIAGPLKRLKVFASSSSDPAEVKRRQIAAALKGNN